jgi:hypothetical protein
MDHDAEEYQREQQKLKHCLSKEKAPAAVKSCRRSDFVQKKSRRPLGQRVFIFCSSGRLGKQVFFD